MKRDNEKKKNESLESILEVLAATSDPQKEYRELIAPFEGSMMECRDLVTSIADPWEQHSELLASSIADPLKAHREAIESFGNPLREHREMKAY